MSKAPTRDRDEIIREAFRATIRLRPVNPNAFGTIADNTDANLCWRVTEESLEAFISLLSAEKSAEGFTRADYEAAIKSVQQRAAVHDCDEDLVILSALRIASSPGESKWRTMATAPKDGRSIMLWWPAWAHYPVRGYWQDGAWNAVEAVIPDSAAEPLAWREFPTPPIRLAGYIPTHWRPAPGQSRIASRRPYGGL